jgi:hypothetical protein
MKDESRRAKPPVHVRTIRVEAVEAGPGELLVTGSLSDERPREGGPGRGRLVHDMRVSLRVGYPDFVITEASAEMAAHPFTVCPEAVPPIQRLVGLSVAQGFSRAVQERLGRAQGCAHLTALVLAMAPVVKQGAGAAFRGERDAPAGGDDLWFIDTCQAWRRDGPLHTLLRRGDLEGLRALSARPRPSP